MVKRFDEVKTRDARALQIWQILIGCPHNRQIISYETLGGTLGFKGFGVMGHFLDPLMCYCAQQGLPPLTVLVVGKYSGTPGDGLALKSSPAEERERVYDYPWYSIYPPTEAELATAIAKGMP